VDHATCMIDKQDKLWIMPHLSTGTLRLHYS